MIVFLSLLTVLDPAAPPRFEKLDNGLRVVVVEDHTLPLVSVQLWYAVGSAQDPPDRPGLTRVTHAILEEHNDATLRLRASGARCDGRVLRDACYFWSLLPSAFLEYALDAEAARMRSLRITAESLKRGLASAAHTHADESDSARRFADRQVLAAMFPNHPYQRPPVFVAASLSGVSPTALQQHHDRWFVPGNTTLFVIGDVSTVTTLELVRRRFGELAWSEPPRREHSESPRAEVIEITTHDPRRAGVDMVWLTPPWGAYENAAIDVLMERLCNAVDGPLHAALAGIGVGRFQWLRDAWRSAGRLTLSLDCGAEQIPRVLEIVREQLSGARIGTPSEIEHDRARALALRKKAPSHELFEQRARRLCAYEVIAGDLLLAPFERDAIRNLSVADVRGAAGLLLDARRVIVRRTAGALAEEPRLRSPLRPAGPPRVDPSQYGEKLSELGSSLPALEPLPVRGQLVQRQWGDGKVRVSVLTLAGLDSVTILAIAPDSTGERDTVRKLMARGIRGMDGPALRDYTSYHGIRFRTIPARNGWALAAITPAEELAASLELLARAVPEAETPRAGDAESSSRIDLTIVGLVDAGIVRQAVERFFTSAAQVPGPAKDVDVGRAPNGPRRPSVTADVTIEPQHAAAFSAKLRPIGSSDSRALLVRDAALWLLNPHDFTHDPLESPNPDSMQWNIAGQTASAAGEFHEPVETALERLMRPLDLIRRGDFTDAVLRTALRAARVRRLCELNSGLAIANALASGRTDPWDMHADLTPGDLRAVLRSETADWQVAFQVRVASEADRAHVERFLDRWRNAVAGDD